jgi:hypothetical protein
MSWRCLKCSRERWKVWYETQAGALLPDLILYSPEG